MSSPPTHSSAQTAMAVTSPAHAASGTPRLSAFSPPISPSRAVSSSSTASSPTLSSLSSIAMSPPETVTTLSSLHTSHRLKRSRADAAASSILTHSAASSISEPVSPLPQQAASKRTRGSADGLEAAGLRIQSAPCSPHSPHSPSSLSSASSSPPGTFASPSSYAASFSSSLPAPLLRVLIPHRSSWFHFQSIDPIEKRSLPEFFAKRSLAAAAQTIPSSSSSTPITLLPPSLLSCLSTASSSSSSSSPPASVPIPLPTPSPLISPSLYMQYRNYLILRSHLHPSSYLTGTEARQALSSPASASLRLHAFLEHWGLINRQAARDKMTAARAAAAAAADTGHTMPDSNRKEAAAGKDAEAEVRSD